MDTKSRSTSDLQKLSDKHFRTAVINMFEERNGKIKTFTRKLEALKRTKWKLQTYEYNYLK